MKNRLELAKRLLREDGVIFVSIDEKQQAYLKILCDEIFGLENILEIFHIQVRYTNKSLNEKDNFQPVMEYILCYSKNKYKFKPNKPFKNYDLSKFKWEIKEKSKGIEIELGGKKVTYFKPEEYEIIKMSNPGINGLKDTWASGSVLKSNTSGKFFDEYLSERKKIDGLNILYKVEGIGEDGLGYRYFIGPKNEKAIRGQFYSGVPLEKKQELEKGNAKKYFPIVNYYDYSPDFGNIRHEGNVSFNSGKKPEKMLNFLLDISTKIDDLVLDFHLGSGTTCAVAHKMGRRYIGIEQMDYIEDIAVERLKKVVDGEQGGISKSVDWSGGGSFVYCELLENANELIREIQESTLESIDKLKEKIYEDERIIPYVSKKELEEVDNEFEKLSIEEKKKALIKLVDKNKLYVNYSDMEDETYRVSESDKIFTNSFYGKE